MAQYKDKRNMILHRHPSVAVNLIYQMSVSHGLSVDSVPIHIFFTSVHVCQIKYDKTNCLTVVGLVVLLLLVSSKGHMLMYKLFIQLDHLHTLSSHTCLS